jgi:hypothetical protein
MDHEMTISRKHERKKLSNDDLVRIGSRDSDRIRTKKNIIAPKPVYA